MGRVTRGIFDNSGEKIYSCSLDSTIRIWSVELGVCTDIIVSASLFRNTPVSSIHQTANSRPMTDVALTTDGSTLLASSSDRVVSIYDPRDKSPSGPPPVLPHPAFPSCLAAHPLSAHKVASGAYDGIIRLWDLRSTKAPVNAFEIVGKKGTAPSGKKILSVSWANGILVAGGEAGVDLWRVTESGEPTS